MKKLTSRMKDALEYLLQEQKKHYVGSDNGGVSYRTYNALIDRGLVRWNAISTETAGGYYLTKKGQEIAEELF